MKKAILVAALLLIVLLKTDLFAQQAVTKEDPLKLLNNWQPGQPIPSLLLEYRNTLGNGGSNLATQDDTEPTYYKVENTALLMNVLFVKNLDSHVFEIAWQRLVRILGPKEFSQRLQHSYQTHPEALKTSNHKQLQQLLKEPVVTVEGLYISPNYMDFAQADRILNEIKLELQQGRDFGSVYDEYRQRYGEIFKRTLADGATKEVFIESISKLGQYTVFGGKHNSYPAAGAANVFINEHRDFLLTADKGDVLILPIKNDLLVLYYIDDSFAGSHNTNN